MDLHTAGSIRWFKQTATVYSHCLQTILLPFDLDPLERYDQSQNDVSRRNIFGGLVSQGRSRMDTTFLTTDQSRISKGVDK
jgi:hypothetical protein